MRKLKAGDVYRDEDIVYVLRTSGEDYYGNIVWIVDVIEVLNSEGFYELPEELELTDRTILDDIYVPSYQAVKDFDKDLEELLK
jgi:hypothetical protein